MKSYNHTQKNNNNDCKIAVQFIPTKNNYINNQFKNKEITVT